MTLLDVSSRLGLDKTALSHMESGRRAMRPDLRDRYIATIRQVVRERAAFVGVIN